MLNHLTDFQNLLLRELGPVSSRYGIAPSFQSKGASGDFYQYLKDQNTGLEIWISAEVVDFMLRSHSANCELQDFDGPDHVSRYFLEKLTKALEAESR